MERHLDVARHVEFVVEPLAVDEPEVDAGFSRAIATWLRRRTGGGGRRVKAPPSRRSVTESTERRSPKRMGAATKESVA
jgi:hypothetical protein